MKTTAQTFCCSLLAFFLLAFAGQALAAADNAELFEEALLDSDLKTLNRLLAPNFLFIASNGHIQDREHFLASVREKKLVVTSMTFKNLRESLRGESRIITGNGTFKAKSDVPLPAGLMRLSVVSNNMKGAPEQIVLVQLTPVIPTKDCRDGNCRIR